MKEKKYMCEAGIITQYGFTKTMIKKYLGEPEKYATNPYYHTAPKEKLWSIETIEKIINLQEVKDYLDKLSLRREKSKLKKEQIEKEKQEKMKKIKELFNIYSLDYLISLSKGYPKNYHLHVGPTNSGKTYHAIEKITSSTKGQYLGPLRLLAMEIADKLNYKNIPCSILTGEEHIAVENSLFTASTIELCDYNKEMDIVVIDEAQLIGDAYRGHNYLKAILLAKAKDIHICLSESGYEIITHILDTAQFTYEVNRYKRLVPLKYGGTINKLSDIEPGDAIIVFSRKKVIQISTILESQGIKTSIIYGKLPPQNRRTQVEAYINHQSDVIVSTDAIGMGISIPIKRIIFWETEKYDGKE